jgi:hypothetical protein
VTSRSTPTPTAGRRGLGSATSAGSPSPRQLVGRIKQQDGRRPTSTCFPNQPSRLDYVAGLIGFGLDELFGINIYLLPNDQ